MGGMLGQGHRGDNAQILKSEEIARDIETLERDLDGLRARVEKDSSSFATLEQEVAQLRENLLRTRESMAEHEARLGDKQKDLAEAKRLEALEAYEGDVRAHHEAADQAVAAATDLLAALDAYDDETMRLRQLGEEMQRAFGSDERVGEVESSLGNEAARLRATSEAVLAATKWRLDAVAGEEPEPADADDAEEEPSSEELSQDLQEIAQERRRARIKEYFGKG
jgi:predicted  nucleic acid-binding Zn-ribbon protein